MRCSLARHSTLHCLCIPLQGHAAKLLFQAVREGIGRVAKPYYAQVTASQPSKARLSARGKGHHNVPIKACTGLRCVGRQLVVIIVIASIGGGGECGQHLGGEKPEGVVHPGSSPRRNLQPTECLGLFCACPVSSLPASILSGVGVHHL